ncbi:VIR protein [Plasmodium vivax]|uniref:VIR protein n=1 Tax=Plasmodium vivax TaxID=5855 RepID=A0A1G4GSG0_PLAVI|nr:VIR protein [Plasmodium vivax]
MSKSVLDELPSEAFYKVLSGNRHNNTYSIDCKNITTDSPKQEKINEICNKLGKNIYYLENDHKHRLLFFDKHCYDLNYWLYEEVTNTLDEGEQKKNINFFFEEIQKQWNKINRNGKPDNNGKKCEPEFQLFNTGLYKPIKELLDYFENFERFKTEMGKSNTQPNDYCENIKKCIPLYFTFKRLCQIINNDICKKYLKENDKYNPEELLSNLSCIQGGEYDVNLDMNLITEMIKTYSSGIGNMLPGFSNFLPGLGSLFTGNLQGMFMNSIYDLMQQRFKNSGLETLYNKIKSYTNIFYSEDFQTYGIPSLFALGCLIFLFIIYKCCGCLPCCCISKRRKKRRKRLSDLDTSELMSAPLGFPSPMLPMNPYGLRYQPM